MVIILKDMLGKYSLIHMQIFYLFVEALYINPPTFDLHFLV